MSFTHVINSTAPAAPSRCPIIDFVELILRFAASSPNARYYEQIDLKENEFDEEKIVERVKKEADSVVKQHEKKEKSAAYKTGVIIA